MSDMSSDAEASSSRDDLGPDFDKGLMALQNKDYDDAVNHFARSLEKNEEDEDIAYNLACCFSKLKDVNQGLYWLERAIEWGLSEGNPDKDSDLQFLKTKAKDQFKLLILKFKNPAAAEAAAIPAPVAAPPVVQPTQGSSSKNADTVTASRSKRATTGQRMAELVGEEAEADDDFWGQDAWNADDVDDDFSDNNAQEKLDVFDSDFNDSEDANDEVYDEDGVDKKRKSSVQKSGGDSKRSNSKNYKDPYQLKQKAKQAKLLKRLDKGAQSSSPQAGGKQRLDKATKAALLVAQAADRSKRTSTKQKSATAEQTRIVQASVMSHAKRTIKKEIKRYTQESLLQEAIQTEVVNQQSLEKMQRLLDKQKQAILPKLPYQGPLVRYHSKINSIDTITFTNVDDFPHVINASAPPYPAQPKCEITGLPAKYKDPLTGKPYATLAAFKTLRARHKRASKAQVPVASS